MTRSDLICVTAAICCMCLGVNFIVDTMMKNDRYADCEMRGGVLVKVEGGERFCDLSGKGDK